MNDIVGELMPYELRSDNTITLLLLVGFVITTIAFGHTQRSSLQQLGGFFRISRNDVGRKKTASEIRFQLFLALQTCLQMGILTYFAIVKSAPDMAAVAKRYDMIAIFSAVFLFYFLAKTLLYTIVNNTFFSHRQNREWLDSFLLLTDMEGLLMFLTVVISVYLDTGMEHITNSVITILIVVKILVIYKCFVIFFKRAAKVLQFILYLCTLEAIPLLLLWVVLVATGSYLTTNY